MAVDYVQVRSPEQALVFILQAYDLNDMARMEMEFVSSRSSSSMILILFP